MVDKVDDFESGDPGNATVTDRSAVDDSSKKPHWFIDKLAMIAIAITVLVGMTTVAGWLIDVWLTQVFADLRVQQVIALAAAFALTLIARRWTWLLVQAVLLGSHLVWIVPAFVPANSQPALKASPFKFLVANVLTSNNDFEAMEGLIQREAPDVFAIVELGETHHRRFEAFSDYPYQVAMPQQNGNFGAGIYSKRPLKDTLIRTLNLNDIVSVAATIEHGDDEIRLIATHPLPPVSREGCLHRNVHMEQLAEWINEEKKSNPETHQIVAGDFNLTPWSPVFDKFVKATRLRRAGKGTGIRPTWYARPIFPMGLVIDHCFIGDSLHCESYRVSNAFGSDHRALMVELFAADPAAK